MKDSQKRIIAAVSILIILVIIFVLPLGVLTEYLIALTMLFGVSLSIFSGMFLFSFKNIRESESFGFVVFGLIIFFFVISGGIIYYQTVQESDEMMNDSLVTTGKIVDGYILKKRNNASAEIKVAFVTADGQEILASEIVTEKEFEHYYIGEEVKVKYSKSSPNVIDIIGE
ncbi:MAG: hypothetical protein P0Y62_09340 [Candidatus Chryseobacterium colombiense]|nr:hypothetical protein [Chryseobacterium sp.]WEK71756.1 MAG: hypothetical protein P0Y62_09340 [Chryseobacterium sp.]